MRWQRRNRELDERVAEAAQRADAAAAELAAAQARYDRIRDGVIRPLGRKEQHNRFSDLIEALLTGREITGELTRRGERNVQASYVQACVVLTAVSLVVFIVDFTRLTGGANWRDPIGLTLTLEAVLLVPDISIALFRWFGPLTAGWLNWEIDAQATTVLLLGLVLAWRTVIFHVAKARGYRSFQIRKRDKPPRG